MEFDLEFIVRVAIITLLTAAISFPFHVRFRKLSFRKTVTNPIFWTSTLLVSIVVALLASLSD